MYKIYESSRFLLVALLLSTAFPVLSSCPSESSRFLSRGAEVMDKKTGLVWARCSVGQNWNGSACVGEVSLMSHEKALERAANEIGWRLPSRKELFSLVDKGCRGPAINVLVFPGTLSNIYWAATPYTGDPGYAWYITFSGGSSGKYKRSDPAAVRLVRSNE